MPYDAIDFTQQDYVSMLQQVFPPADFNPWIHLMIAAKAAGIPYEIVDAWNRQDMDHYNEKENLRHWNSIHSDGGITPATLVKSAVVAGWRKNEKAVPRTSDELISSTNTHYRSSQNEGNDLPHYSRNRGELTRNAVLGDLAPRQLPYPMEEWDPREDMARFIRTVFLPGDTIRIVTETIATMRSDGTMKRTPGGKGFTVNAGDFYLQLVNASCVEDVIGEYDHEAGVWIGANPVIENGTSDKDVTDYRYFLVECDAESPEVQMAQLEASKLPIVTITHSGNKSLHALVHTPEGISSPEEYKAAAGQLFKTLESLGMHPDANCNNASRLTRLPGVVHGNKMQYLVTTQIGQSTYEGWLKAIDLIERNGQIDRRYGSPVPLTSMEKPSPEAYDWIVDGILRPGQMMEIIGRSKAGKSLFALQMCIAVCSGQDFLGFKTRMIKRALYCNIEIGMEDMFSREIDELIELGLTHTDVQNLLVWNLRGITFDIDQFIDDLIVKVKAEAIDLVVLDPLYILLKDVDENDNSRTTLQLVKLQKLMRETGCSVVIVHHESDKKDVSQPVGASAFLRMYDTLLAVDRVKLPSTFPQQFIGGRNSYKISMTFRNAAERDPIGAWRDGVTFRQDETGVLAYCDADLTGGGLDKDTRKKIIEDAIAKLNA